MIAPSLGYGSTACMTQSEAGAKFPKATHLYMRNNCWSDNAVAPVHSPRSPITARAPARRYVEPFVERTVTSTPRCPLAMIWRQALIVLVISCMGVGKNKPQLRTYGLANSHKIR